MILMRLVCLPVFLVDMICPAGTRLGIAVRHEAFVYFRESIPDQT